MRATSGAGSELLMGFHQSQSLLYLEARCLCLQRAMGVQGTQNGGIDGAPVTMSIEGGARELMAENLIAVWLDLECASGNDARPTESEIRVGAKIMPFLVAGSDLICSGMGSILKYDNSFNPSLLNGEELEDFLVLQRDFEADGGLTPIGEDRAMALRTRALDAVAAVLDELDLAHPTPAMLASVATASGSNDTESFTAGRRLPHQRGDPRPRHHRHRRDPRARRRAASARRPRTCSRSSACGSPATTCRPRRCPRRPRALRGQRPQRLPGPRHRLPRLRPLAAPRSAPSATCSTSARCCAARRCSRRPRPAAPATRALGPARPRATRRRS